MISGGVLLDGSTPAELRDAEGESRRIGSADNASVECREFCTRTM